ncbi:alpha/beta fold hydrolase BchO [Jannaschia aquimarina]|uniref:RsbQ protein n=1 Tax=Jannaschia aquimarina TaxID=935700 RepID=A0A0D1EGB6_9RHOB|nr:alpha/beta fold hydrolase BchO [Jannaschia aquimarina]KIT14875.1 Sigma factor SigB regulation protein RsbQ [Jannaschia aquimarina]SNS58119.1 magnesium chelatase accessory protein [Jannaschia aquimarina]
MNWAQWSDRWPQAEHSRFVDVRPYRWHVQQYGQGPDLVLLHGAGAATHSWRGLGPLLAQNHRITAMDLPGHGFTSRVAGRSTLDAMRDDVHALLDALEIVPAAMIGHSAGAAIALRMAQERPRPVVSINGAFAMFEGFAGWLFPVMAKALALNPLTVPFFTATATDTRIRRLLEQTGSRIDDDTLRWYGPLIRDGEHVAGTLAKMANWRLERLNRAAPETHAPVLLLAGSKDGTVPPRVSRDMAGRLPDARLEMLDGLGHLAHEEAPDRVAGAIESFLKKHGA